MGECKMPVKIHPEALKSANELPRKIRVRVFALISRLDKWPAVSGAKPLRGDMAGKYRLRTGDYRVQFHIDGADVVVEKIGHRDGFYD